ncbi:uncharacterized protein LOC120204226 [Hibiscus syriacus]|uniref:uncharacterized protein LOC120204226 n=1 Tax=Hibiscus syriacus TaxID=106335 RepID=UPI001924252F|nr:uncharacterized protein LOC120204226 [Hibiscus syriacus]
MSIQNQGASLSSSAKLKRGRPWEEESVQGGNTPATPETDYLNRNKQSMWIGNPASIDMLGQMVSGVVEGSFDAGYLLNVKVADTNVHLRGVVFLPGLVAPITGANDVAPHAKMYKRKDIPIPFLNIQSRLHVANPPSGKSQKPVEQKNGDSNISDQGLHTGLQPGASVASILPINETVLSLGQRVMQEQIFDSLLHNEKAVGRHLSLQRFEGPNANVEAPEASEPVSANDATSLSATETIKVPSPDLKPKKLAHDDVKSLGVDNNESPEDIDISEDTRLELAQKITNGANTSHIDGLSASDDITTTATAPFPASMTSLPIMIFGEETTPFEPEFAAEESILPTMVVPEVNSSTTTTDTYSVESNAKDAIPTPHSLFWRD